MNLQRSLINLYFVYLCSKLSVIMELLTNKKLERDEIVVGFSRNHGNQISPEIIPHPPTSLDTRLPEALQIGGLGPGRTRKEVAEVGWGVETHGRGSLPALETRQTNAGAVPHVHVELPQPLLVLAIVI